MSKEIEKSLEIINYEMIIVKVESLNPQEQDFVMEAVFTFRTTEPVPYPGGGHRFYEIQVSVAADDVKFEKMMEGFKTKRVYSVQAGLSNTQNITFSAS